MKNKATDFIKRVIIVLGAIAKAKSTAIKSKTSTFKTRLLMLSLMKSKRVLVDSLSHKIHGILGNDENDHVDGDGDGQKESGQVDRLDKAIVLYGGSSEQRFIMEEDDCKYPDLRHFPFEEEDDDDQFDCMEGCGGSVIATMKNNFKEEGEDFKLEDEIDQAADLFIMRFRKQIRLQKLESFKRYKEMQERSV